MLNNREAELTILGMAMFDMKAAEKVVSLPNDAFFDLDTRAMLLGIRRVLEKHGKPDLVTVKLACMELDVDPGDTLLLADRYAITSANYGQYETILMDLRKRRLAYQACVDLATHIVNLGEDADALISKMQEAIRDTGDEIESFSLGESVQDLTDYMKKGKDAGVNTGVAGLEGFLGGLRPERFYVLGARPGVGKTALAIYIAQNVAAKSGPVLVASLEMSRQQIAARIMARETGLDAQKIDNAQLSPDEWKTYFEHVPYVSSIPMRFIERAKTPMEIRREAQAMLRKGGLKLVVIDYLQLMHADEKCGNRQEEIAQISRELKLMTMDLQVPVLALTQFNRESEAKAGMKKRKPNMSEARDSGAIEQDANVFMVLYPPEKPKEGTEAYRHWELCTSQGCEWQVLSIDKNRHGRTGAVSLQFDKAHMDYTTLKSMKGVQDEGVSHYPGTDDDGFSDSGE